MTALGVAGSQPHLSHGSSAAEEARVPNVRFPVAIAFCSRSADGQRRRSRGRAESGRPGHERAGAFSGADSVSALTPSRSPVTPKPVAASRNLPSIDSESSVSQTLFDGNEPHRLNYDRLRGSGPRRFHSNAPTGRRQSPYRRSRTADLKAKGVLEEGAIGRANLRRNRVHPLTRTRRSQGGAGSGSGGPNRSI